MTRSPGPGVGIPRAPRGHLEWHPPPSRIRLPWLKGITDEHGSLLTKKVRRTIVLQMRGEWKDEDRAIAADRAREAAGADEGTPRRLDYWGEDSRGWGSDWQRGRSRGWWNDSRDWRDDDRYGSGESYDRQRGTGSSYSWDQRWSEQRWWGTPDWWS